MPLLTIFSTPKPFTDPHIRTIQRNAIGSWVNLGDQVEVLLIGDEPGLPEVAAEFRVTHLSQVRCNKWGTPLISSIFTLAHKHSNSPLLAYVNADILLTPDTVEASSRALSQDERFLLIGQRWDLEVREELDFSLGWAERLQAEIHAQGRLHPPAGSDYFIYPRGCFEAIPDFAVGRAGWDNWMIYHARSQGWPVVNTTQAITAVHQDHDYRHLPEGQPHYLLEESDLNRALAGGKAHMYTLFDANNVMVGGRIQPIPLSLPRILRRLELWLTPHAVKPHGPRWAVVQRLRRWRRKVS